MFTIAMGILFGIVFLWNFIGLLNSYHDFRREKGPEKLVQVGIMVAQLGVMLAVMSFWTITTIITVCIPK